MTEKPRGEYSVLAALMLAQFILPLDFAMISVALPTIGEDLNVSISAAGWILIIYYLFAASFMISFGRLGDVRGRRKVYVQGLILFNCGLLMGGLSINYGMLLAARSLQALGAAMFLANLPALATSAFPMQERGKALGLINTTGSVGGAMGPLMGGLLSGTLGWRFVFLFQLVFALPALLLGFLLVPESKLVDGEDMDTYGALLLLAVLAPLSLALSQAKVWGWTSPVVAGLLLISLAAVCLFLRHERKAEQPVMELKLFRVPDFTLSNAAACVAYMAMLAVMFVTPFLLQYFLGLSPQLLGLIMTIAFAVPLLVLAPSGILSDRVGTLPLEMGGLVLIALSTSLLAFTGSSLSVPLVILSLVAMGLGFGIFFTPNYSAVMGTVPAARLGVAGGIYGTMRTMGILTGVAMASSVMGVWATVSPALEGTEGYLNNAAFEVALRNAYLAGFLVALAGLAILLIKVFYSSSGREAIGRRV